jgi:hypothetical protein
MISSQELFRPLFLAFSISSILSCSKSNPAPQCTTYYISQSGQLNGISKYYYNSSGLLSSIENSQTNTFIYNASNKLTEVAITFGSNILTKVYFYFNSSGQLTSTTRFDGSASKIDSLVLTYDSQGRTERLDQYKNGSDFVSYSQQYQYPDASTIQVDFYFIQGTNLTLTYTGSLKYTLDGKHKPFPDQYYYLSTAFTNPLLSSNYVVLESFGGVTNSTTRTIYNYNSAGYPVSDSNNYTYTYQCSPPTK